MWLKKDMYILKYKKINITFFFIFLELILGIFVQTTSGILNTIVSYLAIFLSFIYSLMIYLKNKSNTYITLGLLFTLFADIFLVILNPIKQLPAMICFNITQIMYSIRIFKDQNKKEQIIHLIIKSTICIISIILTIFVLKEKTDLLSIVSIIYYANLITNIIFSFIKENKNLLFSIGLILFACCDAIIGLSVLSDAYLNINNAFINFLLHPGFNLAWLFYVPSQTLLALSTYHNTK